MAKLTVSIVNYNAGDYLLDCLESLEKVKDEVSMEIYVVDNDSKDNSIAEAKKKFPKVNFILNKDNLGFGKAHNQVITKLKTEYCLILNPDTKVLKGTLKYLIDYMDENPKVGVATCKLEKEDGSIDIASHRGFPTPWASFKYYVLKDDSLYHQTFKDMNKTHEVDAIVGAFFLTRRSILEKVGGFDEQFFMYAEDIDLCLRIKEAGYQIMYIPEVKVLHYKGVSSGIKKHSQTVSSANSTTKLRAFNAFYESMIMFYKKHYEKKYPFFVNWLVYMGINLKWWLAKRKLTV